MHTDGDLRECPKHCWAPTSTPPTLLHSANPTVTVTQPLQGTGTPSTPLTTWWATSSSTLLPDQGGQGRDLTALQKGYLAASTGSARHYGGWVARLDQSSAWTMGLGGLQKCCRSVGIEFDDTTLWQQTRNPLATNYTPLVMSCGSVRLRNQWGYELLNLGIWHGSL